MKDTKEPGYVYILTNPSFREDWVKIGKSSRPVDIRSKELDNTAVPLPFEIFATMKTVKYNEAEKLVHRYIERFTKLRIRDNREFFNVKPEEALEIFRDVAMVLEDAEIDEVYKDGMMGDVEEHKGKKHPSTHTPERDEKKVWMIPSNIKFFDVEGCFNEFGEVYWSQHYNYQTGDTIYIYSSNPDGYVKFKTEVIGHDLPFSSIMEREVKYNTDPKDFDKMRAHNRFTLLKVIGRSNSQRMTLPHLLDHGMKSAPRGALNLSYEDYKELLQYIEENFDK
ncbi:MAG: GIY-YIG nuclease family protein [Bacteroidales bacterium]|nr:GIY-YIG nuclease family protein [Bacteroidales bacterium]